MYPKAIITAVLMSVATFWLHGQERTPVDLKSSQLNLNILAPGLTLEKAVGANQSLTIGLGLIGLGDAQGNYSINPTVRGSFRNYYSRKRVKKELNPNSGNYVALEAGYYFAAITNETTDISKSFFLGPVWGIQRNYKSGIHFGFSLGPGFAVGANSDFEFTGLGQLQLGFVIK